MAIEDLMTRREQLLAAINKIENGAQEYRIGSRLVRRAELSTLYAEYKEIDAQIGRETRPRCTVAYLRRRR